MNKLLLLTLMSVILLTFASCNSNDDARTNEVEVNSLETETIEASVKTLAKDNIYTNDSVVTTLKVLIMMKVVLL